MVFLKSEKVGERILKVSFKTATKVHNQMDFVTKKLTNFVCTVRIGGGVEDGNLPKLDVYLKNYQKWMIELLAVWLQHPCAIAYMRYHQTKLIVHQSSHKNLTDDTWHKKRRRLREFPGWNIFQNNFDFWIYQSLRIFWKNILVSWYWFKRYRFVKCLKVLNCKKNSFWMFTKHRIEKTKPFFNFSVF